jgi:TldD protein
MSRRAPLSGLTGLAILLVASFATSEPAAAPATDDALLAAMRDETARAASELRIPGFQQPYYVDAMVSDQASAEIVASFGALVSDTRERIRPLRVSVRVGSFDRDNAEFISTSRSLSSHDGVTALPLEDEEVAIRRDLWLAFDAAYKSALEQLAVKQATLQNRIIKDPLADFSRAEPVTFLAERVDLGLDVTAWPDELRSLSAVFREFPGLEDSRVTLRVLAANRYFVSSEGSTSRQSTRRVMLLIQATAQASDGMPVRNFLPLFATSLDELPSQRELALRVRSVARELSALVKAPVLDEYVGPVLFTGQAAGELVAQVLAPELSGHRPPLFESEGLAGLVPKGQLAERVNRMVLPSFISLLDDPTATCFGGEPLIGGYAVDDQGVRANRLPLIEDGRLKTLLMSRRPRKQIAASNGHGRAEPYGGITAHASNLLLTAHDGQDEATLKQKLIELARDAGLEFGLLVRRMEDGGVLSGGGGGQGSGSGGRGLGNGLAEPVLVYRVRVADSSEELIRGINLSGIGVRTLREIVAVGNEPFVDNRFATFTGNMFASYEGAATDPGVPTAVVTPALLLPDVEASSGTGDQERPTLLPHPYFALHKVQ